MKRNILNLFFFLSIGSGLMAQTKAHIPLSEINKSSIKNEKMLPKKVMERVDNSQLLKEENAKEKSENRPFIFAKAFDVKIDVLKEGVLETLSSGEKIWRIVCESKGAYSINLTFTTYKIPEGGEVYIYNKDRSVIFGPLTSQNNSKSKIVPVVPINGDAVTIEYNQSKNSTEIPELIIGRIGHDFRDFAASSSQQIAACNVNINCPEGASWQHEKRSVCKLYVNNTKMGTGVVVNNTNNDGSPYVMTAGHMILDNADALNTTFSFNYEHSSCPNNELLTVYTSSGATLLCRDDDDIRNDFALVKLNYLPSSDFDIYYSGWNSSFKLDSKPFTGIHHPGGGPKKIAIHNKDLYYDYPLSNFLRIDDWDIGTTEGGSSGSPLYNNNHKIIGFLHGGNGYSCNTDEMRLYSNFGYAYSQIKSWLNNSNISIPQSGWPGLKLIKNATLASYITGDIVKLENVTMAGNVVIDCNDWTEINGAFECSIGKTLEIK